MRKPYQPRLSCVKRLLQQPNLEGAIGPVANHISAYETLTTKGTEHSAALIYAKNLKFILWTRTRYTSLYVQHLIRL